ncbi:dipeptide/oligopeptide/nickel ABC transporter ATP-binding protein [Paenibacillus campi]|uniref:ABC transporter ATP-binding protein n=1 Tax=Paenibacillus campi TaxID=3106031 RepID=UPI002B000377|nr:dipeptide/oligopeptide/nickel ABC transporter ATP-binding protein [Paenibacillus sp. SGZ-1014]
MTLLQVEQLCKTYDSRHGAKAQMRKADKQADHFGLLRKWFKRDPQSSAVRALDDVSFELRQGECLGLVGESGSGKSTLARCLLGIEQASSGRIVLAGEEFHPQHRGRLHLQRRQIQIVFQNPTAALNPKLTIRQSLLDPYRQYRQTLALHYFRAEHEDSFVRQLLEAVELPATLLDRYPHQLSGGQRQRVTIARAISIEPKLVVLDEPTASLDVISQAAILQLLEQLKQQLGLAYLLISHDLAAVCELSERIMVMKDGRIVDRCLRHELFAQERHPYTQELVAIF